MDSACENCKYWQYEDIDRGHVCVNDKSYYLAEWTENNQSCEEFERND